ncbi:MAG: hypothetical protein KF752_18625 [Pirellulaceae bacterium]|nr:hypothetical protein [Pirellulaceae bacterium]
MASVLKPDTLQRGKTTAIPIAFNVQDVQSRAQDYLAEIQQRADEILAEAHTQAQQIKEQARKDGLTAAQAEVERQIEERAGKLSDQRCRTAIAACQKSVDKLTSETSQWLARWRDQTVELSAKIAEKLIRREMAVDQELLRVWMEEAIVALRDQREIRVLVHPDDFAVAGRFLQNLIQTMPHAGAIEVTPDPQVEPGGCIAKSQHGQIDQQLQTQLLRLTAQLSG